MPEWQSANAPKQNTLAIDSSPSWSIRWGSGCCSNTLCTGLASISCGGWTTTGWSEGVARGIDLGCVLLIPWRGHFMWPFVFAGLGFRYLRISFLVKLGHPVRKLLRTALNNVKIFGLHNNWHANFTPLAHVHTECMKVARLMPGCIVGYLVCGAQSAPGADCGRVVCMSSQPLIGNVHKSVATSLYSYKTTFLLSSTSHLSLSNITVHLALHNGRMPLSDATARCGTMYPVKIVGNPGIVMSQMCVDNICWPSGMLN